MTHTLILWSLTGLALLLSIFALAVAWSTSDRSLAKRLRELSIRCSDLEAQFENMTAELRKLRARANMQAFRGRKAGESSQTVDPEQDRESDGREWVRSMNERLMQAKLGLTGGGK